MKLAYLLMLLIGLVTGLVVALMVTKPTDETKIVVTPPQSYPLRKYSIENLGNKKFTQGSFEWLQTMDETDDYEVKKFKFDSQGKWVTGLAHVPKTSETCPLNKCPVVVQLRGYADKSVYESGYGTYRSAREFAKAGFVSLAPDFLGYGESASPSADVFEARFETYTTALDLLANIDLIPEVDSKRVGIWGHSNGGHIAMTILEITRRQYPTSLWAPVTAGFPYSILYYMDENSEGDRSLREKLFKFESDYDAGQYSLSNYLENISAPIQLHQGTADLSVPVVWSRAVVNNLRRLDKEVLYFEYEGADHNLIPNWNEVVQKDIEFFRTKMGLTD